MSERGFDNCVRDVRHAEIDIDKIRGENVMIFVITQDYHPRVTTNRPRTVGLRLFFEIQIEQRGSVN